MRSQRIEGTDEIEWLPGGEPNGTERPERVELRGDECLAHVHVAFCGIHKREYFKVWALGGEGTHTDGCPVTPAAAAHEQGLMSCCRHNLSPACVWIVVAGNSYLGQIFHESRAGSVEQAKRR